MDCEYEQFIDLLSNAESDFSFLLRRMMGGFGGRILRVSFLGNHSMVCLLEAIIDMMDGKLIGISWFLQEFQLFIGRLGIKKS